MLNGLVCFSNADRRRRRRSHGHGHVDRIVVDGVYDLWGNVWDVFDSLDCLVE